MTSVPSGPCASRRVLRCCLAAPKAEQEQQRQTTSPGFTRRVAHSASDLVFGAFENNQQDSPFPFDRVNSPLPIHPLSHKLPQSIRELGTLDGNTKLVFAIGRCRCFDGFNSGVEAGRGRDDVALVLWVEDEITSCEEDFAWT